MQISWASPDLAGKSARPKTKATIANTERTRDSLPPMAVSHSLGNFCQRWLSSTGSRSQWQIDRTLFAGISVGPIFLVAKITGDYGAIATGAEFKPRVSTQVSVLAALEPTDAVLMGKWTIRGQFAAAFSEPSTWADANKYLCQRAKATAKPGTGSPAS